MEHEHNHHGRDYQKSKCYRWEDTHVAKLDSSRVAFENIQPVVDHVWSELGLKYPPRVREMSLQKTSALGDATRLTIRFKPNALVPTWVILHELAHSLTATVDDGSDGHGADFVGVYMRLLDKFIPGANLPMLMATANMMKVKFNVMARYAITD